MSRTTGGGANALSVAATLLTAPPFSFVLWGKTNDALDNFQEFGVMSQAGVNEFWKFRLRMTSVKMQYQAESIAEGTGSVELLAIPAQDVWAHFAHVEAANNDRRGYLDGANKTTNASTINPAGIDTTSIGQLDDGSLSGRFEGELGHGAMYDVALSDQEVETLAAGFSPRRLHIDNLVGYWPLNGQSPEPNVIGTGVNLALQGTPPVAEEPPIANFMVAA